MSYRFAVWAHDDAGSRRMSSFHSWSQAAAFAATHGEPWIYDQVLHCDVPGSATSQPHRFILSELVVMDRVTISGGGGGGTPLGEKSKRLVLLAPGLRTSATCWSAFSSDAPWHDCHLHCWASLPYWVLSAPELRAAALALALPLYHRVLESGDTLVCASGTQTYLKRVQAILCPADVKRTAPRRVVLQGCKKCGRIMPAIELTAGGLCYKCGYVRQVAPGIWEDSEEGLHFDIPALLKLFDLPDTPENRLLAAREVNQVVQRQVPNSLIHLRTDVSPAN